MSHFAILILSHWFMINKIYRVENTGQKWPRNTELTVTGKLLWSLAGCKLAQPALHLMSARNTGYACLSSPQPACLGRNAGFTGRLRWCTHPLFSSCLVVIGKSRRYNWNINRTKVLGLIMSSELYLKALPSQFTIKGYITGDEAILLLLASVVHELL